ncbi:MAG: serine/threonine protein kinase [Sandaracinaceae bacterium]
MRRRTKRLGRYHLTERIAFGGMAVLFRAFTFDEDDFKRDVAIKRLLPHYLEDQQFITMLTDEFKLVSHLKHPNIAEVFELVEVDDNILIAMEYVDGKDLRSTVERARTMKLKPALDDIAYCMARALDGLHHAHVARDDHDQPLKIVHRDFSPSNLLIAYDGTVKLCDFGIAKASHNRIQTKTGIIKGKVKYMSPEQAFGRKLDWRSDLFSAGSVLYELATSAAPFHANNEIDLIFAVRDAAPTPAQQLNPEIPDELVHVIEKAMSRSRSARYQTAIEFRDALLRFLRNHNPRYRRTKLSRFMKRVWKEEIERDLRAMEEFVLDPESQGRPVDLGKNLIADALGPDATFSRFSPSPTNAAHSLADAVEEIEELDEPLSDIETLQGDKNDARAEPHGRDADIPTVRGGSRRPPKPPPSPPASPADDYDPIHDEKTAVVGHRRDT